MDLYTTKPIEEIDNLTYQQMVSNATIAISPHAFDHLSERQRKIFKEEELVIMLEKETPRKIYLQANGRYAAYYRKSDGYRKLILEIKKNEIIIVTFVDVMEIPRIR